MPMTFWYLVFVLVGIQLVMGLGLIIWTHHFRNDGKTLLGLLGVEIGIPLVVFGVASLGYWLHPPRLTSDALGPGPIWPTLMSLCLSLLLLGIAIIVMLKVTMEATLGGLRRINRR
jgi:hypothetical protein